MNVPSGWYEDPGRRHELRYWDGCCWTDDVSDRRVLTRDPIPVPLPRSHVDARLGYWTTELVLDDAVLRWGDESLPTADITGLAFWHTDVAPGTARMVGYRIVATDGAKVLGIAFAGRDESTRQAYRRATRVLASQVGGRLARTALARVEAGDRVDVGGLVLDRHGLERSTLRTRRAAWADLGEVSQQGTTLSVRVADPRRGQRRFCDLSTTVPNVFLLPALLAAAADRFAARPRSRVAKAA
jgi:hypothetical protein